jgi:LysM repeat protein
VRTRERDRPIDRVGPSWERPQRREAFPTIKTRMGLSGLSVPPVLLGVAAVVMAAVALFFLPALLGIGNAPAATATPNPTALPSGAAASDVPIEPTAEPGPTMQVYIVQAGDTMSRIANQFGVPLQTLIDANKEAIPNPDTLQIGQEVIIPVTAPTSVPDAGVSPSP